MANVGKRNSAPAANPGSSRTRSSRPDASWEEPGVGRRRASAAGEGGRRRWENSGSRAAACPCHGETLIDSHDLTDRVNLHGPTANDRHVVLSPAESSEEKTEPSSGAGAPPSTLPASTCCTSWAGSPWPPWPAQKPTRHPPHAFGSCRPVDAVGRLRQRKEPEAAPDRRTETLERHPATSLLCRVAAAASALPHGGAQVWRTRIGAPAVSTAKWRMRCRPKPNSSAVKDQFLQSVIP
jgi:hypothetical protein